MGSPLGIREYNNGQSLEHNWPDPNTRPSAPPVFDRLQYAKTEEKELGILAHDPWHDRHMLPQLISTVKSCTRLILHSVLVTKMGQATPTESYTKHYTECMKHTQARSHDSEGLSCDKHQISSYI